MKKEKFPLGSPVVECLPGETRYPFKLVRDFVYLWEGDKDFRPCTVVVPATYQTDFFSVPRFLWSIVDPKGAGIHGSILHDCLYSTEWGLPDESVDRRVLRANRVLRQAMLDSGSGAFRAWVVYQGVQLGGKATWATHDPAEVSDDLILMTEAIERWEKYDKAPANYWNK